MSKISNELVNKALAVYRKNYTTKAQPPVCSRCNEESTLYDQCAGEEFCESCLDISLKEDEDQLFDLVTKFPEMEV